jgi:hypothetical protein
MSVIGTISVILLLAVFSAPLLACAYGMFREASR